MPEGLLRMGREIVRQRASLDLGPHAHEAIKAAQVAREQERARGSFGWVESYRRAMTASFGSSSFPNDLVAAMQVRASIAPLHGISESVRLAASLRDSLGPRTFTSPSEFSTALRRQLDALAVPRWAYADFAGPLGIDKSTFTLAVESAIQAASSRIRAPRASGLPRAAVQELTSALEDEDRVQDVLTEVATAVQKAAARQSKRVSWRFLLPLIIGVLMFLVQWQHGAQTEEAILGEIEEMEARQESIVSSLAALTRALGRPAVAAHNTWLVVQPRANAARTALVAEGASLVILQRHRKWSLVVIQGHDAASQRAGWIRQKYLRYAQSH